MSKEVEEILQIIRDELAANRIDKSDFSVKFSRRAAGKLKRRLERIDKEKASAAPGPP